MTKRVQTEAFRDPNGVYDTMAVTRSLIDGAVPDFSYMLLENETDLGPVIVDVDGEVRWVGSSTVARWPSTFDQRQIVAASEKKLIFVGLDGVEQSFTLNKPRLEGLRPFRELGFGPQGYLVSLRGIGPGTEQIDLIEVDAQGRVVKEWDFAQILSDFMVFRGDDSTGFVRPATEWFTLNSVLYDPNDRSLVVSSRENFVMKLDYETGSPRWLLGDSSKHWYVNYPSLRSLALEVNGVPPVGQHSLSWVEGHLLPYNNGEPSLNKPASRSEPALTRAE